MAGGGIEVAIDGDITPLLQTFAELPGRTQAEMAAVGKVIQHEAERGQIYKGFLAIEDISEKTAKRATNTVLKEMRAAAKASEAATKAASQATAQSFGDLKKGASVLMGPIVGDLEDIGGAMLALGPAGLAAAGAVGGLALAFGALYAEYRIVSMLYDAAAATGELNDEQAALDAAMRQVSETWGRALAPAFEGLMIGVVAGALALDDLVKKFISVTKASLAWYRGLGTVGKLVVNELTNHTLQNLDSIDLLSSGLSDGSISLGGYADRARGLISVQGSLAQAHDKTTKATQRKTQADKAAAETTKAAAEAADQAAYEELKNAENWIAKQRALEEANTKEARQNAAKLEWLATYDQKSAELATAEEQRAAEVAAAQAAAAQQTVANWTSALDSLSSGFDAITQLIVQSAEDGTDAQKKAALVAYRVNQTAAIASILINTSVAIVKALAELGPVAGGIATAGIVLTSAAQVAAVAATPPPTFHTGGTVGQPGRVGSSDPNAPDEVMIRARRGEQFSPRGQAQSNGAPVIYMQYNHRLFDLAEGDRARRASPYRALAMSGKTVGRK